MFGLFTLGITGGIFADQILWPYFIERPLLSQYRIEQPPVYVTEIREIHIQENAALENAIEKVEKTIVGIRAEVSGGRIIEGSGFIVTSDGLMVTLAELIPQGSEFSFYLDASPVSYQVLKRDLKENLALVKLETQNRQTAGFADFADLKLGEQVFLVGTFFEGNVLQKIADEGIVRSFSSTTISINIPGNENGQGTALFDIEGNILGIITNDASQNLSAIPITKIREFIGL